MGMDIAEKARHDAYWDSEAVRRPGLYRELQRDPFATSFSFGRYKLHPILERALRGLEKGACVVDIGCGTGAQLSMSHDLGLAVVGLEPSIDLRTVAQRLNPDVPVKDGSVFRLPFDDASVDFAYAIEVLRYFPCADRLNAYQEILRVLKPGGRFFFTMSNRYALDGFSVYFAVRSLLSRLWSAARPPGTYFVSPRQLRGELRAAGFGDTEFLGCVLGPVRIAYKILPRWSPRIASILDPLDDRLFKARWAVPFAGHLVAVARRPS
jgi:SAM-dependent methyltransferase